MAESTAETRHCHWCDTPFIIEYRPGRARLYCRRSCRQRAYERRHGLAVLPPPGTPHRQRNAQRLVFHAGLAIVKSGVEHAVDAAGLVDRLGRRRTICGVLARPSSRRFDIMQPADKVCHTCRRLTNHRRPVDWLHASHELAALRQHHDAVRNDLFRSPPATLRQAVDVIHELLDIDLRSWEQLSPAA